MKNEKKQSKSKGTTLAKTFNLNNDESSIDFITSLPIELSTHIFSFFSPQDLLSARKVSSDWRKFVDESITWKKKLREIGVSPKSNQQLYFFSLNVLQDIVDQIYGNIKVAEENAHIWLTSYFFKEPIKRICDQHFFAHCLGISTYKIFREVLNTIKLKSSKSQYEIHFSCILYYLLLASDARKIHFKPTTAYDECTYTRISMKPQDYQDILLLIEEILEEGVIDINKRYLGFQELKTPLEQLCYTFTDQIYYMRPSPSIISLLISAGADFHLSPQTIGGNGSKLKLNFSQALLIYETLFLAQFRSPDKVFAIAKEKYIQAYGQYVDYENIATSQELPLSKEFLEMAKIMIQKGDDFQTYDEFAQKLIQAYQEGRSSHTPPFVFIDINSGGIRKSLAERFTNAYDQLEQLKISLKLNKISTGKV